MSQKSVNPETLQSLYELQDESQPNFFNDLVAVFIKTSKDGVALLKTAVHKKDLKSIDHIAHSLKSSCANLGAERMAELCQELEQIGRSGKWNDKVPTLFSHLEKEYAQVTQELQTELKVA